MALDSERRINPATRRLALDELHQQGKVLLVRASDVPFAEDELQLLQLRNDDDWATYLEHRIRVESELGVSAEQASIMVDAMRQRTSAPGIDCYLAHHGSRTVGAISWFHVPGDQKAARLQEVDVFPECRGVGYGNRLLEAARSTLRASDVTMLVVGADEDDWPLDWYRRKGFRAVARVPKFRTG